MHHYYYNPASVSYVLDKLGLKYEILPEQRYDLSNHITWMMDSLPGGQGRFSIFSQETIATYKKDLMDNWQCDTMIVKIYK